MAELNTASNTWSGENKSDCGSEICGQPAKTLGDHHGHSPRAIELARNCTCGKNCDFASHGIVRRPESQGHAGSRTASVKIKSVRTSGRCPAETAARHGAPSHAAARLRIPCAGSSQRES